MFDLKSKLLAAGLVSQEQVDKVAQEQADKRNKKKAFHNKKPLPEVNPPSEEPVDFEQKDRNKQLHVLKSLPGKNEQYELIRRWVTRNRLDKEHTLHGETEKYFFNKIDGTVTWLTLAKDVHEQISKGTAAIMVFMSNNGPSHCVVTRDIAEDVGQVFPDWVRVLINPENPNV